MPPNSRRHIKLAWVPADTFRVIQRETEDLLDIDHEPVDLADGHEGMAAAFHALMLRVVEWAEGKGKLWERSRRPERLQIPHLDPLNLWTEEDPFRGKSEFESWPNLVPLPVRDRVRMMLVGYARKGWRIIGAAVTWGGMRYRLTPYWHPNLADTEEGNDYRLMFRAVGSVPEHTGHGVMETTLLERGNWRYPDVVTYRDAIVPLQRRQRNGGP